MAEVDPKNAGKYLEESEQYRKALQKAVDRAITLAPVMRVRNGTYRSYIPPIFYMRGPSIGQVTQIAMTDDDWPLELVDSAGVPAADDIRVDGHLDVCEDVLAQTPTYLYGGNRFQFLADHGERKEAYRPRKTGSGAVFRRNWATAIWPTFICGATRFRASCGNG